MIAAGTSPQSSTTNEWFMVSIASNSVGQIRYRPSIAYGMGTLNVAIATALTYFLPPLHEAPTDLYFGAIAVTAWKFGRGPAILATIISTLAVDYFIIPPIFSILFDIADVTRFLIFAFVALLICYLQDLYRGTANRLREANDVLESRVRERTAALATANQSLMIEVRERQATEAALLESEGKLRRALDSAEFSLQEKVVLNRELNHRVKNNLQIINSLLSIQASRLKDSGNREILKECQHRVRAIALVHQRLCGGTNLAQIDLAAYFRQLVQELFRSYFVGTGKVTPRIVVDETAMNIDRLVPCALIVNELVCNAFKYAFPEGQSGEVRVEVHRDQNNVCLTVADDGIGFSPTDSTRRDRVGLQIVQALVEQLSGKIQWENGRGTSATIIFPVLN
jgi:two-component sensor histidine kinase